MSENPEQPIPTNAEIEALLRDSNRPPPVSERAPLRLMVSTHDLDAMLSRGIQYQREILEECEAECDEAAARFARAVQVRADFAEYLNSECGTRIEISLFPSERNWMWEVEQAFESAEDEEDEPFGNDEGDSADDEY